MTTTTSNILKGVLIGVGASLVGFAIYKSNEEKADEFLRRHGIAVKTPGTGFDAMSVEDLMRTKENIEDILAERELQDQSVTVNAAAEA
ncbi:MAG: hypothetical protein IJT77_14975 [Clostridia bacterium]|nr:hypothetical protein [Clostridia bacterium]